MYVVCFNDNFPWEKCFVDARVQGGGVFSYTVNRHCQQNLYKFEISLGIGFGADKETSERPGTEASFEDLKIGLLLIFQKHVKYIFLEHFIFAPLAKFNEWSQNLSYFLYKRVYFYSFGKTCCSRPVLLIKILKNDVIKI